jgi:hypothetical protein
MMGAMVMGVIMIKFQSVFLPACAWRWSTVGCISICMMACAPQDLSQSTNQNTSLNQPSDPGTNPGTNPVEYKFEPFEFGEEVPYKPAQDYFQQENLQMNKTGLVFQVVDKFGKQISNINTNDIEIIENGIPVKNFKLSHQNTSLGQIADVVFVLDVTGSMQETIDQCKAKVQRFVAQMKAKNIQANLCLVTFKDHTETKCNTMVMDDPKTSKNENFDAFLNGLSKAIAEGGGDDPENQLRALMDAAKTTPWRPQAQRIAILMTDEVFHYAPNFKGDAGNDAPTYDEAIQAIANKGMMVFNVAPDKPGYSSAFAGKKSLPEVVGGGFFDFQKMIDGKITMDSIFDSIVNQISTQYQVSYVSEENAGLDPQVSIDRRQIQVKTKNTDYIVNILSKESNWPNGRPEYKRKWKLSKKIFKMGTNFKIYFNEQLIDKGFELIDGEVRFEVPPAAATNIRIQYDPAFLKDSIVLKTWTLPHDLDPQSLSVSLNDYLFGFQDLRITQNSSNQEYYFDPSYLIGDMEDPLGVTRKKKLTVRIQGQRKIILSK